MRPFTAELALTKVSLQPKPAMSTQLNYPMPRDDFHLQGFQKLKASHGNLLFALVQP
jgi:hypothetical protein